MQNILVAVRSESFCRAFEEHARTRFGVETCCDGNSAQQLLLTYKPDVLVLDMELPGKDGFNILATLRCSGRMIPVVILTACWQSTYVAQMASHFQVDCVIAKPCTALAVVKNIYQILECRELSNGAVDLDRAIMLLLMDLNIFEDMSGYNCVAEAIKLYSTDSTQQITKVLYPGVAKICGGSKERVERIIRGCIQSAWVDRDVDAWSMYFPARKKLSPPTNGEFIHKMVMCLRNVKTG